MFKPTDVSGCLIWLKADEIQVNSSDYAVSWPNTGYQNCTFTPNPLGQVNSNVLLRNSLNAHSTLRIDLGGGLIANNVVGVPSTSKISAIYLYKQNLASIGGSIQTLFSGPNNMDDNLPQSAYTYSSSLQLSNRWLFYYFSTFWSPTSSQTSTASGYLNDWIIRSDVVDEGRLIFRRNGQVMESGILTTPLPDANMMGPIVADAYNVGMLGEGQFPLNSGQIAEIIVYDHRITDQELTNVENYLKYKYFVGGAFGAPTFINGCSVGTSGQYHPLTPLFIQAVPASGGIDLYIMKSYTISSGTPLYTAGVPVYSDNTTLYTASSSQASSSGTLYTLGATPNNSGITLYTQSADSSNSNVFLYTLAAPQSSGSTDLYISGRTIATSEGLPFYIKGLQNLSANNNTALFIATNTSSANPAVSGIYANSSLFTYAASPGGYMNMYVKADSGDSNNAGMPLFIDNHAPNRTNTADLFIQNSNIAFSGQAKMFVKGLGDLDGGSIGYGSMNLYIERWPAGMTTLFINSSTAPSSTPLYIASANSINTSVNMMISGGQQLTGTGIIPIFIDAGFITNTNVTLLTQGLPSVNQNSTLYTNGF